MLAQVTLGMSGSVRAKTRATAHKHCILAVGVVSHRERDVSPHGALRVRSEQRRTWMAGGQSLIPSWGEFADTQGEGADRIHEVMA